jgi:hypothetical protein
MAARLGNVIYWAGCAAAALGVLAAAIVLASPGEDATIWIQIYVGGAIASWLVGRAARYILAGR